MIQMLSFREGQGRTEFANKSVGLTMVSYVCLGFGSLFILTLQDWPTYILIFLFFRLIGFKILLPILVEDCLAVLHLAHI